MRSEVLVVAANTMAHTTPSVALASNVHAANSPGSDRLNGPTVTRGSAPMNGISSANTTNGISTVIRAPRVRSGILAVATSAATSIP